jgi:hypothetical protein
LGIGAKPGFGLGTQAEQTNTASIMPTRVYRPNRICIYSSFRTLEYDSQWRLGIIWNREQFTREFGFVKNILINASDPLIGFHGSKR